MCLKAELRFLKAGIIDTDEMSAVYGLPQSSTSLKTSSVAKPARTPSSLSARTAFPWIPR